MARASLRINAKNETDRAFKQVNKNLVAMRSATKRASIAIVGLFAIHKITRLVGSLVSVNRQFQALQASLLTVTGSADLANKAFAVINAFATKTPFSVKELTDSFIKLTALGLEPSRKALESYGNTASAFGKSLNQFVEAVADAVTFEFERLKEFGIKARSETDKIAFTFQGATTRVGKNAKEIEAFLRGIGQVQFAGAMARQAKTLDGAFSNLGDALEKFAFALGEAGLNQALIDMAKALTSTANGAQNFAKVIGSTLGFLLGSLKTTFESFATLFSFIKEGFTAIGSAVAPFANTVISGFVTMINAITGVLERGFSVIKNVWRDAFEGMAKFALGFVDVIILNYKRLFDFLSKIPGPVGRVFKTLADEIDSVRGSLFDGFKGDPFGDISSGASKGLDFVIKKFKEVEEAKRSEVSETKDLIIDSFEEQVLAALKAGKAEGDVLDGKKKKLTELQRAVESWKDQTAQAFLDVRDLGSQAFSDLAKSIMDDLARIAIKKSIVEPLFNALGSALGSLGGFPAPVPGGAPAPLPSGPGALPLPFAAGGRPAPGKVALVGERGPELFVPDNAGTVIPNNKIGGGSQETTVKVIIENKSSTPVQAASGGTSFDLDGMVTKIVLTDLHRGGRITKALQETTNLRRATR